MIRKHTTVKPDYLARAASVVSYAIGENLFDGSSLPDKNAGKDAKAVDRGRIGGLKGGVARAEKLSAIQRKNIAKKAAKSRWKR